MQTTLPTVYGCITQKKKEYKTGKNKTKTKAGMG